ncbi:MFS transporter [Fictibacillus enclensis]|uniref:MFS transporter n=1 Tax=Fictibacillus enclensis TaxID=1017270 RepID=UPI0025A1C199|nr:MFS transporter [Fictibacillus enclensis]MDM5338545.1 MFS transporter [Fictibacillus enclensis]
MGSQLIVDEAVRKKQMKKAAIASIVGTSIEWYDFFLYGTMAALVFPKLFFPESDSYIGVLQAFTTLFIGFLARPIGAAIFGNFGDKIGRKATLVTTLMLMGISSTIIGLLPTYNSLGIFASVLLVGLRFLQGIGVGGEWGGSVVLSIEWSSKERRGLMGSMTQLGVPIGLLISTLIVSICIYLTGDSFEVWGWRIPFLISIMLVAIGLYIRLGIEESPQFSKMKEEKKVAKQPILQVIKKHPKEIILGALSRLSDQVPFYIFTTFAISFGTEEANLDKQFISNAVLLVSVAYLIFVPLSAHLSDRFGRKPLYYIGSILTLVFALPYFYFFQSGQTALIILAVAISGIGPGMVYGPQAALIAENFPLNLRYSGSSLAYQFASIIGGGIAPIISVFLLHEFGSTVPISIYIMICCVISIFSVSALGRINRMSSDEVTTEKNQKIANSGM